MCRSCSWNRPLGVEEDSSMQIPSPKALRAFDPPSRGGLDQRLAWRSAVVARNFRNEITPPLEGGSKFLPAFAGRNFGEGTFEPWSGGSRCADAVALLQRRGGTGMRKSRGISRRSVLELTALGGLAMTRAGAAFAQPAARRIERLDPALDAIISVDEPIKILAEGYGGDRGQAEGPVWWADRQGGYLLFSDINNSRRIKYAPGQGASVFKEGTNRGNGLTRDQQGRLVVCEADAQRVTRIEADGSVTVIANNYQGKRL